MAINEKRAEKEEEVSADTISINIEVINKDVVDDQKDEYQLLESNINNYNMNNAKNNHIINSTINEALIVKQAECKCCGLKEECTAAYISQVEECHSGKWVCGLCSEAVKEAMKRAPAIAMDEALCSQRDFCHEYNTTTRLNPKLSFTSNMRDIAKRSFQTRNHTIFKLSRSSSCVPRILLN